MSEYNKLLIEADFWKKQTDRIDFEINKEKTDFEHEKIMKEMRAKGNAVSTPTYLTEDRFKKHKELFLLNNEYRKFLSLPVNNQLDLVLETQENFLKLKQVEAYNILIFSINYKLFNQFFIDNNFNKEKTLDTVEEISYNYVRQLTKNLNSNSFWYTKYYKSRFSFFDLYNQFFNNGEKEEKIYNYTNLQFDIIKEKNKLLQKSLLQIQQEHKENLINLENYNNFLYCYTFAENIFNDIFNIIPLKDSDKIFDFQYIRKTYNEEINLKSYFNKINYSDRFHFYINKILNEKSDLGIIPENIAKFIFSHYDFIKNKLNSNLIQIKKPTI